MKKASRATEVESLLREIQRYLAYVDAFRAKPPKRPTKHREDGNA